MFVASAFVLLGIDANFKDCITCWIPQRHLYSQAYHTHDSLPLFSPPQTQSPLALFQTLS